MNLQDVLSGLKGGQGVDSSKQNTVTVQGNTRRCKTLCSLILEKKTSSKTSNCSCSCHCNESYLDSLLQRARWDKRRKHCVNDTWGNHIINILIKSLIFWVPPLFYAQLMIKPGTSAWVSSTLQHNAPFNSLQRLHTTVLWWAGIKNKVLFVVNEGQQFSSSFITSLFLVQRHNWARFHTGS